VTLPPQSRRGKIFHLPLLVLLTIPFACGLSQIAWEKQLHQLYQIENSNKTVARFFKSLNIPYKSDTVFVFIVSPMTAARIEGVINPFIRLLRKAGVKADIITLVVYNKRRAAEMYLQRRHFVSDYNLVTDEKFLNSFVFSAGILEVPFIAKFCIRSGEVLSSYSLLGTTDSATVAWFISDLSKPKIKRPVSKRPREAPMKGNVYKPVIGKRIKLSDSDEFPLSTSDYLSVNPSGSCVSLRDNLTNYIYIFDLTTGRLLNVLFPDSSEEAMFVNVPVPVYQWLKQNNVVNSMYFSHGFCDDTTLIITASLPKVVMEVTGADTSVGYHNVPVLIKKNILDNKPISCARFQSFPDTVLGGFSHIAASFEPRSNLVFVPFHKGWPSGNKLLDEDTPREENPFADEFYQRNVYQLAVYNVTGEFVRFLGALNERFERLRLGYFVADGLVRKFGDRYWLSDRYSGKIYSYNQDLVLNDSITVFDEPPPVIPAIDRREEPLRYLLETFKLNFKRRIVDFLITQDFCYVLFLEENQPVVYRLSLEAKRGRRFVLPRHFENKEAKYYLLRETKSGIVTISFLESPDETFYCEFQIPDNR